MGNSLHNKIYLGRRSVALLHNKRVQALLGVGACAGVALAWLALRTFR